MLFKDRFLAHTDLIYFLLETMYNIGWLPSWYDKHTRSTAADQPALLPDYKVTWLWGGGGGGGMISTPAQLLQTSLLLYRTWLWGGGRGGGDDTHTRPTAADQPAPLPDYTVTWLWGGGGAGGGMISTPAQLLQTSLLLYRTWLWGGGGGGGMTRTPAQQLQTSLLLYRITQ